jgi:hypothetical protein
MVRHRLADEVNRNSTALGFSSEKTVPEDNTWRLEPFVGIYSPNWVRHRYLPRWGKSAPNSPYFGIEVRPLYGHVHLLLCFSSALPLERLSSLVTRMSLSVSASARSCPRLPTCSSGHRSEVVRKTLRGHFDRKKSACKRAALTFLPSKPFDFDFHRRLQHH